MSRLIDAKQMEKHIMESKVFNQYFKELVQSLIWGENTIEAEPVKHGRWIHVTNGRCGNECNICHEYAPSFQNGVEYKSIYCPKCGAKMDKEELK